MNFTLTISGETPAELLDTLTQLGGMTINVNTSPNGGVETHTMTAAELPRHTSPLPQSEPVQQPDKPKAQTTAKAKKPTREPAVAPAEEPANPTSAPAQNAVLLRLRPPLLPPLHLRQQRPPRRLQTAPSLTPPC